MQYTLDISFAYNEWCSSRVDRGAIVLLGTVLQAYIYTATSRHEEEGTPSNFVDDHSATVAASRIANARSSGQRERENRAIR